MTKQEENWELMTVLQIPWHHASKIEEKKDRDFLLDKAKEVKSHIEQQQKAMMEAQQQQSMVGAAPNIVTP